MLTTCQMTSGALPHLEIMTGFGLPSVKPPFSWVRMTRSSSERSLLTVAASMTLPPLRKPLRSNSLTCDLVSMKGLCEKWLVDTIQHACARGQLDCPDDVLTCLLYTSD